jgi:hypothetical protein
MSHYEINKKDVGRAYQCGNKVVEVSTFAKRDCQGSDGRARRVETAGIPLCPGSKENATNRSIAGRKSGIHGEAAKESVVEGEAVSEAFRRNYQYDGHTSIGEVSSKRALKWVNLSGQIAWSWSIALTDYPPKRWRRSTGFWCRAKRCINLMMTYA